jgi:DNA-binding CsgD family transcriptional regulator/tetratricopeptide (TPR) repeat protein
MADPSTDTDPAELERLADAAWWVADLEESLALRQRAYAGYAASGDGPSAAFVAVRLCFEHFERGEPSIAMGWLMRAERDVRDVSACVQHGYVSIAKTFVAQEGGDVDAALQLAERAMEIGQRFGDRDLTAMSIHAQGRVLIKGGRVAEGMALLDEAMTSVIAGELGPHYTGVIFCSVLEACLDLADVGRAGEWSDAAIAWCATMPPEAPFTALCRINRAQVAGLRGAWSQAENEASMVADRVGFDPMAAARAFYETGEIRRRIGNVAGAEECFARASEIGFDPQPGLALLRFSQGKVDGALHALRLAVDTETGSVSRRSRLLAAQVDVAIAGDELAIGRAAADELEAIATASEVPALGAAAAAARGAMHLAEGDMQGAIERLRHACTIWQELKLPYEAALARRAYGVALRAAGHDDDATMELRASLTAFERLGAVPDAATVRELLAEPVLLPRGLTAREAEVLRLVATGKTNRDIAADLVISEHTVARHLQNIFAKLDVTSRAAATAFAFEHGLA